MTDPISDLLNRIRNAGLARHASTRVPYSKIKVRIVEILRDEGYVDRFEVDDGDGLRREIVIYLRYLDDRRMAVNTMKRVSKPGRRFYCRADAVPQVKAGLGVAIVSTSRGVISDREARRLNVGGEVLCEVW